MASLACGALHGGPRGMLAAGRQAMRWRSNAGAGRVDASASAASQLRRGYCRGGGTGDRMGNTRPPPAPMKQPTQFPPAVIGRRAARSAAVRMNVFPEASSRKTVRTLASASPVAPISRPRSLELRRASRMVCSRNAQSRLNPALRATGGRAGCVWAWLGGCPAVFPLVSWGLGLKVTVPYRPPWAS